MNTTKENTKKTIINNKTVNNHQQILHIALYSALKNIWQAKIFGSILNSPLPFALKLNFWIFVINVFLLFYYFSPLNIICTVVSCAMLVILTNVHAIIYVLERLILRFIFEHNSLYVLLKNEKLKNCAKVNNLILELKNLHKKNDD